MVYSINVIITVTCASLVISQLDLNHRDVLRVPAGCYGTLGLESGGVADSQLSASSVWEWSPAGQDSVWTPSGARLKKTGLPWAPAQSDQQQWLQIDFRREKKFTGMQPNTLSRPRLHQVLGHEIHHVILSAPTICHIM